MESVAFEEVSSALDVVVMMVQEYGLHLAWLLDLAFEWLQKNHSIDC
jgi:hypothetical protein